MFQERYGHRGSSEPASVNITDLTTSAAIFQTSSVWLFKEYNFALDDERISFVVR